MKAFKLNPAPFHQMKSFKVGLRGINAEKMWDFTQANRVHVHFVHSITAECDNPVDTFNNTVYVFEILMTPETYTAFALSLPLVPL